MRPYRPYIHVFFYIQVRCAHNPPPCHCFANFAAQQSCLQHFFKDRLSRSAENKSAKNKQFCDGFSWLWEVKIMIFGHFGGSGRPFWLILTTFCSFWGFLGLLWFLGQFRHEMLVHFWSHFGAIVPLLAVLFFSVFLSARFSCFLWFWVARGSILAPILPHFWDPLAFVKSVKSVQLSSISEVWPLPDRVFLQALIAGAFWWRVFVDFCDFWLFGGSHF